MLGGQSGAFLGDGGVGEVLAGPGEDGVEGGVVVVGVVVEEDQLFDVGAGGEAGGFEPCAMAPADAMGEELGRVLSVVDEDVRVGGGVKQAGVGGGVAVFVVGGVDDGGVVAGDAIAGGSAGVVEGEGFDVSA